MTSTVAAPTQASTTTQGLSVDAAQPVFIGAESAADRPARRCFNG